MNKMPQNPYRHAEKGRYLNERASDWLEFKQAAFFFIPEYTGRGKAWVEAVRAVAKEYFDAFGESDWQFTSAHGDDDEVFRVRIQGVDLVVYPLNGFFVLLPVDSENNPLVDSGALYGGEPADFCRNFEEFGIRPNHLCAASKLLDLSSFLRERFDRLDTAIQEGHAEIMARQDTVTAPFSKIQPDQWRYFIPDPDKAYAKGPNGEQLFAIWIAPASKPPNNKAAKATINLVSECADWLADLMRASPGMRTDTKANLRRQAKDSWPNLPDRGFDSAWERAKNATEAVAWAHPGRPRKSPRW